MPDNTNQNQRMDDQNFDVDIDEIYKKFIVEIDNIRSESGTNLKESRCHAFYRLIGLPVSDGTSLYSPGMDKPNNSNTDIITAKENITSKINKKLKDLMDERENLPRSYLSIFSLQDVNATVLAMSSVDVRPFAKILENDDPFDTELTNQSYQVSIVDRLKNTVINNGISASNIMSKRYHYLKPFLVDPRIDSNIKPARNRLAVPFLKDKSEIKLNDNDFLKRPYIEKVCRDRFSAVPLTANLGDHTIEIINSIKSNPSITNNDLIKSLDPNNITSDQVQFVNYLNIIRSMLKKLFESTQLVNRVLNKDPNNKKQAIYNWLPIPNKLGLEFGSETRDISLQTNDIEYNTDLEKQIIELQYQEELKSINNKLLQQKKVDLGGFAFENTELTPDSNSSDAFGNQREFPLEKLISDRNLHTDKANEALKHIEIIMGEFSGLGLCDILAICTALWVVEKEVLLNLVDDIAIQRMNQDKTLQTTSFTRDVSGSIKKFETKIKEVFDLMDKIFDSLRKENITVKP